MHVCGAGCLARGAPVLRLGSGRRGAPPPPLRPASPGPRHRPAPPPPRHRVPRAHRDLKHPAPRARLDAAHRRGQARAARAAGRGRACVVFRVRFAHVHTRRRRSKPCAGLVKPPPFVKPLPPPPLRPQARLWGPVQGDRPAPARPRQAGAALYARGRRRGAGARLPSAHAAAPCRAALPCCALQGASARCPPVQPPPSLSPPLGPSQSYEVFTFEGPGVGLAMYNTDDSIRGFAKVGKG